MTWGCADVVRCHSFVRGGEQSLKASVGVVFASKWPVGQLLTASGSTPASPRPRSADGRAADTASAEQDGSLDAATCGQEGEEGDEGTAATVSLVVSLGHAHAFKQLHACYRKCSSFHECHYVF